MGSSTSQWKPIRPAQLAELFLMNRFRTADCHSELPPIFDRHHFGTIIDMTSESLSTSVRNVYRHRPESAPARPPPTTMAEVAEGVVIFRHALTCVRSPRMTCRSDCQEVGSLWRSSL